MIPIYEPYNLSAASTYVYDAIDSGWISYKGKYVDQAKERLQELLGVKYVLPVFNGTCAMHLVAKVLKRFHPDPISKAIPNRLIVPSNVYVAAWNSFLFDKGDFILIPVAADLHTWNYNLDALNKAIIDNQDAHVLVVSNIGSITNVPALKKQYSNTIFVEDNCEGLFGKYEDQYAGTASFAAGISFYANKCLTTGEGGAFITNDEEAYDYAKRIAHQGQTENRFEHDVLGYNYRITNIQAAILCSQLNLLDEIVEKKSQIFETYRKAFNNRDDVFVQQTEKSTRHSDWMFGLRMPKQKNFEQAEKFFNSKGIEIRPMFFSLLAHKHLRDNVSVAYRTDGFNPDYMSFDVAENLRREAVILPSFPGLTEEEQTRVIWVVEEYLKSL
jgi:perosamine synthetase